MSAPPARLVERRLVAAGAEPDEQQPARRCRRPATKVSAIAAELALEALRLGGAGGERAARLAEPAEAVGEHVLAPHRQGEGIGAVGARRS